MELTTHDGMTIISKEDLDFLEKMEKKALNVRRSIIVFNKTNDVARLNEACRLCGDLLKLFDALDWR